MFFDKYVSVTRLTAVVGNTNKGNYQAVSGLQSVLCNIQPQNAENSVLTGGIYGKTFIVFTTTAGIKEGDILTVSGTFIDNTTVSKQLRVNGVANWFFPPLPHFEINCLDLK
jgi:hypothetical protein